MSYLHRRFMLPPSATEAFVTAREQIKPTDLQRQTLDNLKKPGTKDERLLTELFAAYSDLLSGPPADAADLAILALETLPATKTYQHALTLANKTLVAYVTGKKALTKKDHLMAICAVLEHNANDQEEVQHESNAAVGQALLDTTLPEGSPDKSLASAACNLLNLRIHDYMIASDHLLFWHTGKQRLFWEYLAGLKLTLNPQPLSIGCFCKRTTEKYRRLQYAQLTRQYPEPSGS